MNSLSGILRLTTGQKINYGDPRIIYVVQKIYDFFQFLQPGPFSFLQLYHPWAMKLFNALGFKTGLNTYTELIRMLEKEIERPTLTVRMLIRYSRHRVRSPPGVSKKWAYYMYVVMLGKIGRLLQLQFRLCNKLLYIGAYYPGAY